MAEGLLGGAVGDEDERAEAAEPPCGPRCLRVRS
jgi:hypothetical protein